MILRGGTRKFRKKGKRKSQDNYILTFFIIYGIIILEKGKKGGKDYE